MRLRVASRLVLALALAAPAAAVEVQFVSRVDIESGAPVRQPIPADLDRDGDLDLVAFHTGSSPQVVWYENTAGDGSTWSLPQQIAAVLAGAILVADVDGDGDLDVVAVLDGTNQLVWYANQSDAASFASAVAIATGVDNALASADFERDGDVDVAYMSTFGSLRWARNEGDGSNWTPDRSIGSGGTSPWSRIVAVDLDGDGDVDVAASQGGSDDRVAWFEDTGAKVFSALQSIDTGFDEIVGLLAADLDRDGDLDLATAAGGDAEIHWLENTSGDGSSWSTHFIVNSSPAPSDLASTDLDMDGDAELLLAVGTNTLTLENSLGDASQWDVTGSTQTDGSTEIAVGDVDADGDPDLLAASESDTVVGWSPNQTVHRSSSFPQDEELSTGATLLHGVVAADLDSDGDSDLAVASAGTGVVRWHANTSGDGSSFGAGQAIDATAPGARGLTAADLDQDGDLDLIAASFGDERLVWHENRVEQSLAWVETLIDASIADPVAPLAADVDGNGELDVLAGSEQLGDLSLYRRVSGSFLPRQGVDTGVSARGIAAGDLDRDGDLDLVAANEAGTNDRIDWYENDDGSGTTWTRLPLRIATNLSPSSVEIADLDGDGDLDVASCNSGAKDVVWHENDGTPGGGGDWTMTVLGDGTTLGDPDAFSNCSRVRTADFDRDGDVDVVSWHHAPGRTVFFENTSGDGSAWTPQVGSPFGAEDGTLADLDRDGRLDPIGTRASSLVSWLPDRGGQFGLPTGPDAYAGMVDGRIRQVLRIDATHLGRAGDLASLELATFALRFSDDFNFSLSSAQANALISEVCIHVDDLDGVFDAGGDTAVACHGPLALVDGVETIAFADGDPLVAFALGTPRRYFVALELAASASSASPNRFNVQHLRVSGSTAQTPVGNIPLSLEIDTTTLGVGAIEAVPAGGDPDGDGLTSAIEADTWDSDPLVADTDTDGLGDGAEVNTHGTNPTDHDTDDDGLGDGIEIGINTNPLLPDTDGDGFCDGLGFPGGCTPGDNCPAVSNAPQANGDGFAAGDACQCGNVDGAGALTSSDYARAREHVVGRTPGGSFDLDFCDLNGDAACDVADLAILQRAVAGEPASILDACDGYRGP